MLWFNEAINSLGIVEIPLHSRKYTWTIKQHPPLLERLDWFFTSMSQTTAYPITLAHPLTLETSYHWPCFAEIKTEIPKGRVFRFENCWVLQESFMPLVEACSTSSNDLPDQAKNLIAKFKSLRGALRSWEKQLSRLKELIAKVKLVLSFMEAIEERRDLSILEWNFKDLINEKLINLLHQQRVYQRQIGAIKWIKLGDENTSFFHANATIKHRKNLITSLMDFSGNLVHDHNLKANILWRIFRDRLGSSYFQGMLFDLPSLFGDSPDLLSLVEPFTTLEIDRVVQALPSNKSPGPDEFNNNFIKKCWRLIKQDFYRLCEDFYNGNICLRSINSSFITLIPKVDGSICVNDFRPISLLNSSVKIITKLLANRLQPVITSLVHKN